MINAKIIDTAMGLTSDNKSVIIRLAFIYFEKDEEKYIVTPNIMINSFNDIATILQIAEATTWESLKNKTVQIDIVDNNPIVIANILDPTIQINFIQKNTENNEENVTE